MTEEMNPQAIVVLSRIHAGYGGADVLKGVSLDFRRGETLALLGPNGAGKSTLIRVLTGALAPRSGSVTRGEKGRTAVGLVPQEIALYPWLSPRENCLAFGRLSGLSRAQSHDRIGPVMQLSGCHAVEGVPVSRLSGGYQRRANVAAALMNEPDLLVLDEPTAGLDADGRNQVAAVVSSLRQAGATVMLVTHDFEIAETIADRIGILTEGVLCCLGELNVLIGERLGERERVEFILKEPPGLERRARLAALGARSTPEGRAWRVWRRLSNFDTAVVAAELAEAGLQVAEIRVRKPGLADLFAATTGEGQAA